MNITIDEHAKFLLELTKVSVHDIRQILENPDQQRINVISLDAPLYMAQFPFMFQAIKWHGELVTYIGGGKRGSEYHVGYCMVAKNTLPNGMKITKRMSMEEICSAILINFTPHENRTGINLERYADWYAQTFSAKISLETPALRAIETPRIEGLGKQAKARTFADKLNEKCDEFKALLGEVETEEPIHQWLAKKQHMIFFGTDVEEVKSKKQVSEFVTDFVVKRTSMPYLLVEIETTARIFNKSKEHEPCARFNHACTQVRDWQREIRKHLGYFREKIGDDLYEPEGLVVMGRSADIDNGLIRDRWRDMMATANPRPMTFDDLIARVRNFAKLIRDPANL